MVNCLSTKIWKRRRRRRENCNKHGKIMGLTVKYSMIFRTFLIFPKKLGKRKFWTSYLLWCTITYYNSIFLLYFYSDFIQLFNKIKCIFGKIYIYTRHVCLIWCVSRSIKTCQNTHTHKMRQINIPIIHKNM